MYYVSLKIRHLGLILFFLLFVSFPVYAQDNQISILHINDANGNVEPVITELGDNTTSESGGFARISYFVSKYKEKKSSTIFVSSGDMISPMPLSATNKGKISIELLNMSGLDVWSPGNFDFLYGFRELEKRISEAKFPVISSNIFIKNKEKTWLPPYVIIEKNNKKIAFLGATSLRYLKNFPADVDENIDVRSPFDSVKKFSEELKGKADLIVLIAQLSVEEKTKIMNQTDVDLIVGGIEVYKEAGITNLRTQNGKVSSITRGITQSVGEVDIAWENDKPKFDTVQENFLDAKTYTNEVIQLEKSKVASLLKKYENKSSSQVLSSFKQNPSRDESQSFLVGLIRYLTGSDLAIFRKGFFLRGSEFSDKITSQDIFTIISLPFKAALVKINGSDLKAYLRTNNKKDYIFNGVDLENGLINGVEIDDTENYILCTDEYDYKSQNLLMDRGKVSFTNKNINYMVNDYFLKNRNKTFDITEFDNFSLWKLKFLFDFNPELLNVSAPKDKDYKYLPWSGDQTALNLGGIAGINFKRYWDKNEFDNFFNAEFRQQQIGTDPIEVVADRIRFNSVFRRELFSDFSFGFSELRLSTLFVNPEPEKSHFFLGQLIAGVGQNLPFGIRFKEGLEVRKSLLDSSLPWEIGPHLAVQMNQNIFFLEEKLDARIFIPLSFNNFITEIENRISLPITDKFNIFYTISFYDENKDFKDWAIRHNIGINFNYDTSLLF